MEPCFINLCFFPYGNRLQATIVDAAFEPQVQASFYCLQNCLQVWHIDLAAFNLHQMLPTTDACNRPGTGSPSGIATPRCRRPAVALCYAAANSPKLTWPLGRRLVVMVQTNLMKSWCSKVEVSRCTLCLLRPKRMRSCDTGGQVGVKYNIY